MNRPTEGDPHRGRWWLFVGGGALVNVVINDKVFVGAMVGLGLMLLYSLAEAIAERPGRDRGRTGTEHEGDASEPAGESPAARE